MAILLLAPSLIQVSRAESEALPIAGDWEVGYGDRRLGRVEGTARIGEDETAAEVTLVNPWDGREHRLTSSELTREGNRVRIVLEGQSPFSERETGQDLPFNPVTVPEATGQLKITYGDSETELTVAPRAESDLNKVTLELTVDRQGLSGSWKYRADPVLDRDPDGFGRVGIVTVEEDGTTYQSGPESWVPLVPIIYGVFPLENQLADVYGEPAYSYPFQPGRVSSDGTRRNLFVFGKSLPRDFSRPIEVTSDSSGIGYLPLYTKWDAGRGGFAAAQFERGFEKLLEGLPESEHAAARELDALIVRADLAPGVVPGHHGITVNGGRKAWHLQFGDNSAVVSFARTVGEAETETDFTPEAFLPKRRFTRRDGTESTSELYLSEAVFIEVRTRVQLPVDEIPVLLSHNGKMVAFPGGGGAKIIARRAADPRVYRTGPIHLVGGGGEPSRAGDGTMVLPSSLGSRLSVKLGVPELISVPPPLPVARVLRITPEDDTLWHQALTRVAACHEEPVGNWSALALEQAAALETTTILNVANEAKAHDYKEIFQELWDEGLIDIETQKIKISFGDQAAMLLMKDSFLDLMRRQYRQLNGYQSDDEIRAFRALIEPMINDGRLPLGNFTVADPNGELHSFAVTYLTQSLADGHQLTVRDDKRWVLTATRQVIRDFRRAIARAIEHAEAVDSCEAEELLELTGLGYDSVVASLLPRLMTPFDLHAAKLSPDDWTPDRPARAAVQGIDVLARAVRDQHDYGNADKQVAMTLVSVATFPLAMGTSAAAVMLSLAVDVVDLAWTLGHEIPETWASHKEAEFARGASAVLGTYRLDLAEQRRKSWGQALLSVAVSLGSTALDVPQIPDAYRGWQAAHRAVMAKRGQALAKLGPVQQPAPGRALDDAPGVEVKPKTPADDAPGDGNGLDDILGDEDGIDALFRELSEEAAEDLAAAVGQADDIRRLAGDEALDATQRALLERVYGARNQALAGERPAWAEGLDEDIYDALKPHLDRPDVHQLMIQDAGMVAQQLRQNRRLALEVLNGTPHLNPIKFRKAVEKAGDRVTRTRDGGWFDKSGPTDRAQLDRIEKADKAFMKGDANYERAVLGDLSEDGPTRIHLGVRQLTEDGKEFTGSFARSYDKSTGTFTLHHAYRMDVAAWLKGFDPPLVEGRGIPTSLYVNLNCMRAVGIGYAGSGNPLSKVVVSNIVNARTAIQLGWLMRAKQFGSVDELLPFTFSYQYARDALTMAGYRIKSAKYVSGGTDAVKGFEAGYLGYNPKTRKGEPWKDFVERHGLSDDSRVPDQFSIELEVEPISGSASN